MSKLTYYVKKLALKPFLKQRVENPMSKIPYILAANDDSHISNRVFSKVSFIQNAKAPTFFNVFQ